MQDVAEYKLGMDEKNRNQQSIYQRNIDKQPPLAPLESPPEKKVNIFIVGGIIFLILLVAATVIFFLVRGRTSSLQGQGSPQPTPSFYELVTQEIQKQDVKLRELETDAKALDEVLAYVSVNFSDVLTPTPPQTAEWQAQKTEIAKVRAELEIDRRITTLNNLIAKIDSSKKLSLEQKAQLNNEIAAQISHLSSLNERIKDQTNFQALVADINILSDSYKGYAVVVPKVSIAVIADKINVLIDTFTVIADKLAEKTEQLEKLKKNVASVQKTLGHMLYVLGDTANKAEIALVSVLPLSSESLKSKSVLLDAKSKVQISRKNLQSSIKDARNILNSLKAIESGKSPQRDFFQFFPLLKTP